MTHATLLDAPDHARRETLLARRADLMRQRGRAQHDGRPHHFADAEIGSIRAELDGLEHKAGGNRLWPTGDHWRRSDGTDVRHFHGHGALVELLAHPGGHHEVWVYRHGHRDHRVADPTSLVAAAKRALADDGRHA